MYFFDHEDLGNHLLQLCPKLVKHPVYISHLPIYDMAIHETVSESMHWIQLTQRNIQWRIFTQTISVQKQLQTLAIWDEEHKLWTFSIYSFL